MSYDTYKYYSIELTKIEITKYKIKFSVHIEVNIARFFERKYNNYGFILHEFQVRYQYS